MKLVYWTEDPAACNVVEHLEEIGIGAVPSEESILYTEDAPEDADFCVVLSTHRSESGKSTLTVHPTGNWGSADFGGNQHQLCPTWPPALKVGLRALQEAQLPGYEVSLEVTHHGPSTWKSPLVFIEIGSNEAQWTDKKAGKVLADAVVAIQDNTDEFERCIGFGGTHYAPSFTKLMLENDELAFGHMAPKYASEFLDKQIIREALEKSFAERAVIDWKGIKSEPRKVVTGVLEELGIDWNKTSELH